MSEISKPVQGCLKGSCTISRDCARCGFNEKEDARRKQIPLTLCEDGLRRKIIPRKPHPEGGNDNDAAG